MSGAPEETALDAANLAAAERAAEMISNLLAEASHRLRKGEHEEASLWRNKALPHVERLRARLATTTPTLTLRDLAIPAGLVDDAADEEGRFEQGDWFFHSDDPELSSDTWTDLLEDAYPYEVMEVEAAYQGPKQWIVLLPSLSDHEPPEPHRFPSAQAAVAAVEARRAALVQADEAQP